MRRKGAAGSVNKLQKSFLLNVIESGGDLRARFYPAYIPICEKELKFRASCGVHTFNFSMQKAEVEGPLRSRQN